MKSYCLIFLYSSLIVMGLSSCSITKRLGEAERLYTGASVTIEKPSKDLDTRKLQTQLNAVLAPTPNRKLLGVRWRAWVYQRFYPKREGGLRYFIWKQFGEAPVIYDQKITNRVEKLLMNRAQNNGFLHPEVEHEVKEKKKKISVAYKVKVQQPFIVTSVEYNIYDEKINDLLKQQPIKIKVNAPYDLRAIIKERNRLANYLKELGYYYFENDNFIFRADSVDRQIQLSVELKDELPPKNLRSYTIQDIHIYPNYNPNENTVNLKVKSSHGLWFYYDSTILIRPGVIRNALMLEPNDKYTLTAHKNSLKRLGNLALLKYINIRFEPDEVIDTNLVMYVYMTPKNRQTVEGAFGLSVSTNGYIGPEFSATYTNRNLFNGSEIFQLNAGGVINSFFGETRSISLPVNNEFRVEARIAAPGISAPGRRQAWQPNIIGQTKFDFSYEHEGLKIRATDSLLAVNNLAEWLQELEQNANYTPSLSLDRYELKFGYLWRRRPDVQHEFNPIRLQFQDVNYETEDILTLFDSTGQAIQSESFGASLDNILLLGPDYTLRYDSRLASNQTHNVVVLARFGMTGTISYPTGGSLFNQSKVGIYTQLEPEFRYFYQLPNQHVLAFRFATGIVLPLSANAVVPYFDLYSVGGVNSLRAFNPRVVGPGTWQPTDGLVLSGTGDIRLETTLEFRYKLSSLFEPAIFIDAGNVWFYKSRSADGSDANAVFQLRDFYKELAIGAGTGMRINFGFLVARLDVAFPLSKPWLVNPWSEVPWKVCHGSSNLMRCLLDEIRFNFGFGYPF